MRAVARSAHASPMTSRPPVRKDSTHLSHRAERIGVMVERVGAKDGRERAVIERELLRVGDDETNVLDAGRQLGRPSNHLRGQVHPDDEPRHGTRSSRGCTRSAPDVEEQIIPGQVQGGQGRLLHRVTPPGRRAAFVSPGAPIEPTPRGGLGTVHRTFSSRSPRRFAHRAPSPHPDRAPHPVGRVVDEGDPTTGPG